MKKRTSSTVRFFQILSLGIGAAAATEWLLQPNSSQIQPLTANYLQAEPGDVQSELRKLRRSVMQQNQSHEKTILANPGFYDPRQ